MSLHDHSVHRDQPQDSFLTSRAGLVLLGFIAIAGVLLFTEHRAHVLGDYVRHPQYVGFILVMFGFLLQWPTILTLVMFPILVVMYVKLARSEERDALAEFGETYRKYLAEVPSFFPRLDCFFWRRNRKWAL